MMDTITSTNKKNKKVSYRWRRSLMIYLGLPLIGVFYSKFSIALFNVFIQPTEKNLLEVYTAIGSSLGMMFPLILIFLIIYSFIQLFVYSVVMEFIVLPWIKNKYAVIFISAVMCLLFPIFSITGGISFSNLYDAGINLCLIGFISGIFIGYMLYCSYRKELEKNNKK